MLAHGDICAGFAVCSQTVPYLGQMIDPRDAIAALYSPPRPTPPTPPSPSLGPSVGSYLWRLSGAPGQFAMIGLGDIVLPGLALAYARRVDLARRASRPGLPGSRPPLRRLLAVLCAPIEMLRSGGYYPWAVGGYGLGLFITQCANAYGWTFNDVKGQPALLYLVPGVLLTQLARAMLCGELSAVWHGGALVSGGTGSNGDSGSEGTADETRSEARLLHRGRDGGKRCWCD